LCIPLDLHLSLKISDKTRFSLKLVWLFGLVKKQITERKKKRFKRKKKEPAQERPHGRIKPDVVTIFKVLRVKGLFHQVKRLLKDIFRLPRLKIIEADFKVGLDDPADTGLLFSYLGPAAVLAGSSVPGSVNLQPSFADQPVLQGSLHAAVRMRPVKAVVPFMRFFFSIPVLKVVKLMVIAKWKRRKKS